MGCKLWTELWDRQDKSLYLDAKGFSGNVSKGNVQTKADVEEAVNWSGNTVLVITGRKGDPQTPPLRFTI